MSDLQPIHLHSLWGPQALGMGHSTSFTGSLPLLPSGDVALGGVAWKV